MKLSEFFQAKRSYFQPTLVASKELSTKVKAIHDRWPDVVKQVEERDREKVLRKILWHLEHWQWDGVKMSVICAGAPIVFDDEFRERTEFAKLQAFYLNEAAATDSALFISAMVAAYIRSYAPASAHTRKIKKCLDTAHAYMGPKWQQVAQMLPEFFDANSAHLALAEKMLDMDCPWLELKAFGISRPHDPGLMAHAHLAYVQKLAPRLNQRSHIERLFAWLKPEGKSTPLMTGAAEAINAVLGHWVSKPPPESLSRYLTETLVALYGDPRLSRGGGWGGVDERCRNLVISWLTRENILFFLDVVSAVEDSHMWEPRRKFWLDLYNQGKITAAWVAFSREAATRASAIKKSMKDGKSINFGEQDARKGQNTSLLILKIGRCVVVEGSHNYSVRIFKDSNPKAPEFYKNRYDCDDIRLRQGVISIPHQGNWQNKVREQINYIA